MQHLFEHLFGLCGDHDSHLNFLGIISNLQEYWHRFYGSIIYLKSKMPF